MAPHPRVSWRLRLARTVLRAASFAAPSAERDDWLREWRAEIDARLALLDARGERTRAAELDLLRRSLGGLLHAMWLRRQGWTLDMLVQDLRYAVRSLAVRPGFTLVAALTLALGIGAATAIFSVAYGVLLRPLPLRAPDRLVQLWESNPLKGWTAVTVAPANLKDWIDRNHSFASVAYYFGADDKGATTQAFSISGGDRPERLDGLLVSPDFFDVLGVEPRLGRGFAPGENTIGRHRVIVLSDGLWKRRFGADPRVVGREVRLNGQAYQVIGVAPAGFEFPSAGIDFWAPMAFDPAKFWAGRRPHFLRAVARLKPGVTFAQARDDLHRIAAELEREHPDTNEQMGAGFTPVQEWMVGDTRRPLVLLLAAVSGLLLIACANVAGLVLVRGVGRARELAVRAALGAGRARLVRQLLTESALLAALGGAAGLVVARAALSAFRSFAPADLPRFDEIRLDWPVLAAAVAVTLVSVALVGLVPALRHARVRPDALKEGGRGSTAAGQRTRRLFVVSEVALSVVLVVAAGLLVRSFDRLVRVDPGFDAQRVLTFEVSLPGLRYDNNAKVVAFFRSLVERLQAIPGVRAAGATSRKPLTGYRWTDDFVIEGRPGFLGRELRHKEVTPGYFRAMGVPLLNGRPFAWSDDAKVPSVAVINEAFARQYFPGVDPVGRRISYTEADEKPDWVTIIGVAGNEKQDSLAATPRPEVFDPLAQSPTSAMTLVLQSAADPTALVGAARGAVESLDPALAVYSVETMAQVVGGSVSQDRFLTALVGLFASLALVLACVGLYGLVSFTVSARTQEIGVRMALGARRGLVLALVVGEGIRLVAVGLVLGLVVAAALTRGLASLLFEVTPTDPLTFAGVAALFIGVAVVAVAVPARRASRVDPLVALRYE